MNSISPRFAPVPLASGAERGAPLFQPIVDDARGIVAVGGPLCVQGVKFAKSTQSVVLTAKAITEIAGYALYDGFLYVQDGAVLSAWNLSNGRCTIACNLRSGERLESEGLKQEELATLHQPPEDGSQLPKFSAPVIRKTQLQSDAFNVIFVLSSDGNLYPLGNALRSADGDARIFNYDAQGAVPALALWEYPSPADETEYECRLYYMTADGGMRAIDATGDEPLALDSKWPARGLDRAAILPLRAVDGLVWGAGFTGAEVFALTPDPAAAPALSIPPESQRWSQYEVDPATKLCLVSDGLRMRQRSYARGAQQRDRCGLYTSPSTAQSWVSFWAPGTPGQPTLILHMDQRPDPGTGAVTLRLFAANPVDTLHPELNAPYPPPARMLVSATLDPFAGSPPVAWVRTRPVIVRNMAYFAVNHSADFSAPDCLIACPVADLAAAGLPLAADELKELERLAKGLQLEITQKHRQRTWHYGYEPAITELAASCDLTLIIRKADGTTEDKWITTDSAGVVALDTSYAGATVTLKAGYSSNRAYENGKYVDLRPDLPNAWKVDWPGSSYVYPCSSDTLQVGYLAKITVEYVVTPRD